MESVSLAKVVAKEKKTNGETLTQTITVTNNSTGILTHAIVSDQLPDGVTLVKTIPALSNPEPIIVEPSDIPIDDISVSIEVGPLAIGASKEIQVIVTVDDDAVDELVNMTQVKYTLSPIDGATSKVEGSVS